MGVATVNVSDGIASFNDLVIKATAGHNFTLVFQVISAGERGFSKATNHFSVRPKRLTLTESRPHVATDAVMRPIVVTMADDDGNVLSDVADEDGFVVTASLLSLAHRGCSARSPFGMVSAWLSRLGFLMPGTSCDFDSFVNCWFVSDISPHSFFSSKRVGASTVCSSKEIGRVYGTRRLSIVSSVRCTHYRCKRRFT